MDPEQLSPDDEISKRLSDLAERIQQFSKSGLTGNETNLKKKVIELLLGILGWDVLSNEVQLEYPVTMGSKTYHVDYALLLEDKPVAFVEAKKYDEDLIGAHVEQIISYSKVKDVRWGVLTNGRTLRIFDASIGKTQDECIVELDLRKLPSGSQELMLISRNSILSGQIESIARRLLATKKAIREMKRRENEISLQFQTLLNKNIGSGIEDRIRNISSQLVKEAIRLLEGQAPSEHPPGPAGTISREELSNKEDGDVIVCASRAEGVEFLKKYEAWGFVTISKARKPKYFALYVGRPSSSILYFAEIDRITEPIQSREDLDKFSREDTETFRTGTQLIYLKHGTLKQMTDPIPLKDRKKGLRGMAYSTVKRIAAATDMDGI